MKNPYWLSAILSCFLWFGCGLEHEHNDKPNQETNKIATFPKPKIETKIVERDGSSLLVEISIDKGSIFGMSKLQQNLPEGFQAEVVEEQQAVFSCLESEVKFIWMSLPKDNQFNVKYKILLPEGHEKDFDLGGVFYYLDGNSKASIDITPITVSSEIS
ncbi:MAG: hypothetical protein MRY83_01040 [Flavobacteriales bacterium]|nr:hypothetical protein [Flavobacteriales bacterium]